MEKMIRELPFGKATARITVCAWTEEIVLDGISLGSSRLHSSKKVEIIAPDGKVISEGFHADVLEYNFLTDTYFDKLKLDPNKKYSRVGDKTLTIGAEAGEAINAAISEMVSELEIRFQGYSTADKEREAEVEEAKAVVAAAESEGVDKLMTAEQIKVWRKGYNDLYNEGGEGYIPSRVSREQYESALRTLQEVRA